MKPRAELFKKILVANRGEIAVRVIRACRELSIGSVAVYSEADRAGLHCQMADEAVLIGPAPSLESYLHMDRIIEAARRTGSQAIHPGYGFLAENSDFCRRCEKEGIVFIGPNSAALELVGDKVRARQAMEKAGVAIIPGMKSVATGLEECVSQARKIGYPVMVKASAGGGGKGMRVVCAEEELRPALEAGQREAKSAFGDDSVYLEKYIEEPRHVEFQVLADNAGHTVHLFERECSIQRRHQKIVEESPSPALDPELRAKMGETARKVMMTAGYNNAGTVEFLLDKDRRFYFLEVNARLQVEHPVTEMVTGVDLVHQQIRIASGQKLELRQEELRQRGHAIECRIYAIKILSISAWVKRAAKTSKVLVAIRRSPGGYILGVGVTGAATNQIKMTKFAIVDIFLGDFPQDTNWHHLVGVWDEKGQIAYIDDVLNGNSADTANFSSASAGKLLIGGDTNDQGYTDGTIDDVGIFNVALTEGDVKDIMNQGLGRATGLTPVSPKGRLATVWGEIKAK